MRTKEKFGLFTSTCIIIGIVIGSGIFFKSDNVLVATNGSIILGIMVFCIAAFAIIFGSLSLGQLAVRTEKEGGIIAYAEENIGPKAAVIFGWVQNFVYYPTIIAVVASAAGIYICILFGIDENLEVQMLIGVLAYTVFYIINYLSAKLAGTFQNISTIMKLLPLVIIALAGIFFGEADFSSIVEGSRSSMNPTWIAAIGPIAFSYDGWVVATSISHEIKDAKKNLPKALIIAPTFILVMYIAYFIGISLLIGPEKIMTLGDAHVDVAFTSLFGEVGSNILLVFVIISILGTTNGLILGGSRGLYALGLKRMVPFSDHLANIHGKKDVPLNGLIGSFVFTTFWMGIHYMTSRFHWLPNSDVSEISIVTMYLLYMVLYLQVIKLARLGQIRSKVQGYLVPVLAILGSIFIFIGGIQNPMFLAYVGVSGAVMIGAYVYSVKYKDKWNIPIR